MALRPSLKDLSADEELVIDFEGVDVFSPSWGDEFLSPLHGEYGDRLVMVNTENIFFRFGDLVAKGRKN